MLKMVPVATAACLALAGCAGFGSGPHPLDDTSWRMIGVETSGTSTQLTDELSQRHRLTFVEDGRLQMQLDCNRGNADWSAASPRSGRGALSIGQVASTRAFCQRPTFGEELARELPGANTFTLSADGSELSIRTENADYLFVRE